MSNLLFICSKNQWRSPTAEPLFKDHQLHHARSAGTSDSARIKINQKLLNWADIIFVMKYKHKDIIRQRYLLNGKELIVLGIKDNYQFGDPKLVVILTDYLSEYLQVSN